MKGGDYMEQNLKNLQKTEALNRLRILQMKYGLLENVITEFEKEETLYYSEYVNKQSPAILYWVSNKEEYQRAIKEFEEEHDALVYHAILTKTVFGTILTLLYVSEEQTVWKEDREQLQEGIPLAYCINLEDDTCSEFGGVQIAGAKGGITRLA